MAGTVDLEIDGATATVTFNNPKKRNSFDPAMLEQLAAAAERIAGDDALRCVLLRGAGEKAFSAGADFDALTGGNGGGIRASFAVMDEAVTRAEAAMRAVDIPIVAGIRGACFGGGVQMALLADIRVAADDSRYCIPAVALGIVYPMEAVEKIVHLCGPSAAKRFLIGGEQIDAAGAHAMGLVDEVAPAGELDGRLAAFAETVSEHAASAVHAYKKIIDGLDAGRPLDAVRPLKDAAHESPELIARLEAVAARRAKKG